MANSVRIHKMTQREELECKVTPRRWLVLAVFSLYLMSNQFQWISYSTITDKVAAFYVVPTTTVDWLSMIFMIVYIPLIFPATWLLDKKGLRLTAILGSGINFLGAAIKCFSPYSNRFAVTFIGQTIAAIAQVFMLGIPSRVASVWFAEREVPLATGVGVFGVQLGVALGFLVPLIVPSIASANTTQTLESESPDIAEVLYDENFALLFYIKTGVTGALFLAVLIVFKNKPKHPPNPAQAAILPEKNSTSYLERIKILGKDLNFLGLVVTFGQMVGAFLAIGTLLNQIVLYYFEGQALDAGYIGVTMAVSGMLGSVGFGAFLSWSGRYKQATMAAYVLALIAMVAFMVVPEYSGGQTWPVFVTSFFIGLFVTGYIPVGYELAAELTYPAPEGTTSGLLNCSAQVFGLALTLGMGELLPRYGPLAANGLLVAVLSVGCTSTFFIRSRLKRTIAGEVDKCNTVMSASMADSTSTDISEISKF